MNPVLAVVLTVLLGSSMYLAGRLHARVGYRFGYRYGYRQGYFDGDRACWNRIRREAQGTVPYAIEAPPAPQPPRPRGASLNGAGSFPPVPGEHERQELPAGDVPELPGTTYASSTAAGRHAQGGYVAG